MIEFYQAAYEWRIGFERILRDGGFDPEAPTRELIQYCEQAHPYTRDIHKALPDGDPRKKSGTIVWATRGGLECISRGKFYDFFDRLDARWKKLIRQLAREQRKRMDWQDDDSGNYLIDPEGNRRIPGGNGQHYGPYTYPTEYFELGDWDGEITDDTEFTK